MISGQLTIFRQKDFFNGSFLRCGMLILYFVLHFRPRPFVALVGEEIGQIKILEKITLYRCLIRVKRSGGIFMSLKQLILNRHHLLWMLLLVLIANLTLYYSTFGKNIVQENSNLIVIGSLIDIAIVMPILFISWRKKWHFKSIIIGIATGLILVRFIIPMEYLQSFVALTWIGFAIEGIILIAELYLVFSILKYLPKIIESMKNCSVPTVFNAAAAIEKHLRTTFIIKVLYTEFLMLYYALISWCKGPNIRENEFTLYKNSSLIATYVLAIHSILIETIVLHWWIYSKFPIISIILLILNVYTIFFLLGNLQVIRHNALHLNEKRMYLSFGLIKRMKIDWENVDEIIDDPTFLRQKLTKDTIDFIARDLEPTYPDVILKLSEPTPVSFIFGMEKKYQYVAIRVDEFPRFRKYLQVYINSN